MELFYYKVALKRANLTLRSLLSDYI